MSNRLVAASIVWLSVLGLGLHGCGAASENACPSDAVDVAPIASTEAAPSESKGTPRAPRVGLSAPSKQFACGLRGPMTVEAHLTKDFGDAGFAVEVEALMSAFTDPGCASKVETRVVEITTEKQEEAARKAGLSQRRAKPFVASADAVLDLREGFSGFVVRYGGEEEVLAFFPPDDSFTLEYFLLSKMREVAVRVDGNPILVGCVTTGHEPCLSREVADHGLSLITIMEQYCPFYDWVDVDGSKEIPKALAGLIVVQSDDPPTEQLLRHIDDFLMLGAKSAAFYVAPVRVRGSDPRMEVTFEAHGYERLLAGYGVEQPLEVVLDPAGAVAFKAIGDDGKPKELTHAATPFATGEHLDKSFAGFFGFEGVPFPFASPLVVRKAKQPAASYRTLARTTATSGTVATPGSLASFERAITVEHPAERLLAVLVEGKLESAFAKVTSKSPSRVLVVSSPNFFENPFARAGKPPPLPPQLQMMGPMGGDERLKALGQVYASRFFAPSVAHLRNVVDWMGGEAEQAVLTADLLPRPDAKK